MEFLGDLFGGAASLLGSGFLGGLTALLGIGVKGWLDYKNKKLEAEERDKQRAHEIAQRKADAEIMAQEWAARTKVAEVEADSRRDVAASEAFAKSYDLEPERYAAGMKPPTGWLGKYVLYPTIWGLMFALDFWRGAMRPGLTTYLAVLVTIMFFKMVLMIETYGAEIPVKELVAIVLLIINTVVYLFTTSYLWWFGTRNSQPAPGR